MLLLVMNCDASDHVFPIHLLQFCIVIIIIYFHKPMLFPTQFSKFLSTFVSFECLSSFVYLFISIYVRLIFCIPHCLHSHFNFHHRRRNLGESELKFEMLERNARRLKNGKFPKMPKCPSDIIEAFKDPTIYDRYALNLRKTKPFYIDTICAGTSYFTIFASHQVIDMINKHIPPSRRNYLIDGTFKVTPIGGYCNMHTYIQRLNIDCK